jgi:hypothetical protein
MRIRLAVLVVLLAAVAAAGCASAEQPMSRAQARTVARAINLTPANLPGARHFRYTPPADQQRALAKTYRCVGVVPRTEALADMNSDQFATRANTSLTSHVWVMRSTDVAARDVAALGSRRARACFSRDSTADTGRVSVQPLRSPVGAGPGVRTDGRDRIAGRSVRIVADQFAFQTGPAEVILVVATVNRVPDAALERSVLAVLLHRAGQSVP